MSYRIKPLKWEPFPSNTKLCLRFSASVMNGYYEVTKFPDKEWTWRFAATTSEATSYTKTSVRSVEEAKDACHIHWENTLGKWLEPDATSPLIERHNL